MTERRLPVVVWPYPNIFSIDPRNATISGEAWEMSSLDALDAVVDAIIEERSAITILIGLEHDIFVSAIICDDKAYTVFVWTKGTSEVALESVRRTIRLTDVEAKPCADEQLEVFLTSITLRDWIKIFLGAVEASEN